MASWVLFTTILEQSGGSVRCKMSTSTRNALMYGPARHRPFLGSDSRLLLTVLQDLKRCVIILVPTPCQQTHPPAPPAPIPRDHSTRSRQNQEGPRAKYLTPKPHHHSLRTRRLGKNFVLLLQKKHHNRSWVLRKAGGCCGIQEKNEEKNVEDTTSKLGNVDRIWSSHIHVSMDDPTVGISHRGTFPSPRHIRYLMEPDMPTTLGCSEDLRIILFSLTDSGREDLSLP